MSAPVQFNEASAVASATTIGVSQTSNPVVGNLNIVWVRGPGGATVSGVTDSLGNTYTARGSVIEAGTTQVLYQFTAPITTGGSPNTVTATYGASTGNRGIYVVEAPGNYDASNTGTDTGNNPTTSVSATNTSQPATVYMLSNFVQGGTPGVGTGFTDIGLGWGTLGLNCRAQYKEVTNVGSQSGNFVNPSLDRQNTGIVIVTDFVLPIFSAQPTDQTTVEGGTVTFTTTVTGADSFQWETQAPNGGAWSNVSGGTGATADDYTTGALTRASDAGRLYRLKATNGSGDSYSNAVAAVVTTQPSSFTAANRIGVGKIGALKLSGGTISGSQSGSVSESSAVSETATATVVFAASRTETAAIAEVTDPSGYASITESTAATESAAGVSGAVAAVTESAAAAESSSYPAGSVVPSLIVAVATGATDNLGGTSAAQNTTGVTMLRVVVESQTNTLTNGALTDNRGNSYVIDSGPFTIGTFPGYMYVYRPSAAPSVGAGHTFTLSAAASFASTWVIGVGPSSGGTVSLTSDQVPTDTTKPYVTDSITPAQDNSLLIGWAGDDSTGGNVAWAWTSPSTIISAATLNDHNSVWGGTLGQRTVTTAGSYTMEATNSGTGGSGGAIIFSFTEVAGGGAQTASQTESAAATEAHSATAGAVASASDSSAASETSAADGANSATQAETAAATEANSATKATASSITEVIAGAPAFVDSQNDYQLDGSGFSPQLVTIDSQTGNVVCLCVLGDSGTQQTPTDNYGNNYTGTLLHSSNYFANQWAPYNMRVYGKTNVTGGANHTLSVVKSSSPAAEATLVAIAVAGTTIQGHSIVARQTTGAGGDHVSGSVTTTGPAFLLSFWSGDGNLAVANLDTEPLSGTGWTLLHMVGLEATAHIQHALAIKVVGAGTHTITWHNLGDQGCIISLIAVQGGTLAELTSAAAAMVAAASESAASTATHAAVMTGTGAAAESAAITQTQSSGGDQSGTVSESSAASDAPAASYAGVASRTETAATADAPAAVSGAAATAVESAAATEAESASYAGVASLTESTASSDTQDASSAGNQTASQSETAALTEAESAIMTGLAAGAESAAVADAPVGTKSTAASQTDSGGTVSSTQDGTNLGGITTITETAALTEAESAIMTGLAAGAESAAVADAPVGGALGLAARVESAAATESSNRVADRPASTTDSVAATQTSDSTADSGLSIVAESVAATQTQSAQVAAGAVYADALTLVDFFSSGNLTFASQSDSASVSEVLSEIRTVFAAMLESSAASETSSNQSAAVGLRVESVAVADVPVGTIAFTMADISEAAALVEVTNSTLPQAGITESVAVADVVNWVRQIASGGTRVYTINDENRTLTISTESRTYTVSTR